MVTFQLMECADDAIKALFAADGAGLKGKVSKKKALAQLLCDMIGAPMLSPDEAESAGARVATRLVNMGKEDAAAAKAEARAARGSDDAAVAAVLARRRHAGAARRRLLGLPARARLRLRRLPPLLPPRTPPPGSPPRCRRESALGQVLPKAATSSTIATSATAPALVSSVARVAAP